MGLKLTSKREYGSGSGIAQNGQMPTCSRGDMMAEKKKTEKNKNKLFVSLDEFHFGMFRMSLY